MQEKESIRTNKNTKQTLSLVRSSSERKLRVWLIGQTIFKCKHMFCVRVYFFFLVSFSFFQINWIEICRSQKYRFPAISKSWHSENVSVYANLFIVKVNCIWFGIAIILDDHVHGNSSPWKKWLNVSAFAKSIQLQQLANEGKIWIEKKSNSSKKNKNESKKKAKLRRLINN